MTSNRTFGWPGLMTVTTAAEYLEMHSRSLEDLQSKGLVTPVDSGKGNALKALCEHLGLAPDEVIACGDSATDVPMLTFAGTSIGVQPCAPAVTEVATHLVTGAGQDELFQTVRLMAGLPTS